MWTQHSVSSLHLQIQMQSASSYEQDLTKPCIQPIEEEGSVAYNP